MKRTNLDWMAVVILVGAIALGCDVKPDDTLGSFCARSETGGDEQGRCVQTNQGPGAAWDKAMADGGLPIQMWAERPNAVTLDQLVESPEELRNWYANIDTALAFVRDTKKCADCYEMSLGGVLQLLLQQAKDRQAELLAQKPVDAVANFKSALNHKATTEKSPLVASIANDKRAMNAVQAVFDQAKKDAAPLSAAFTDLAAQFTTYRATEAAETQAYTMLAQQASQSTLATLPDVEQAILAAGQQASAAPNGLVQGAIKLSAQIQAFEVATEASLAPHADFLATHRAAEPDMTSSALRSLNAMLGYIQQRLARSDATATSLLNGTAARHQALTLLNGGMSSPKPPPGSAKAVSPLSLDALAQTKLQKAASLFSDTANARVAALALAPLTSTTLKLPYLARRYDQLTTFVQLETLCAPSSSSWREAGCTSLRSQFSAAESELRMRLPTQIAAGIALMSLKGIDLSLLDAAQAKLATGDVKGAAITYDAAVRGTEGT